MRLAVCSSCGPRCLDGSGTVLPASYCWGSAAASSDLTAVRAIWSRGCFLQSARGTPAELRRQLRWLSRPWVPGRLHTSASAEVAWAG